MKQKTAKKFSKELAAFAVASVLTVSGVAAGVSTSRIADASVGHAYVGKYQSYQEAVEDAKLLNEKMSAEGTVLLKNKDNALPLTVKGTNTPGITVFGEKAEALYGASDSSKGDVKEDKGTARNDVRVALKEYGFKVADTVVTEKAVAADTKPALETGYKDVAVVVLARTGGEGSDAAVITTEEATDAENVGDWEHTALGQATFTEKDAEGKDVKDEEGKTVTYQADAKHYLQLTNAEIGMIKYAEEQCTKVVVVLNTANAMEMYNLEHDNEIDAILNIGRPGTTGLQALPKILSGAVNPSGRLTAVWAKDFTADPTWYNSIANAQNNIGTNQYKNDSNVVMYGIDYDEDIYIGYKYYETVYAEILAGRLDKDPVTEAPLTGDTAQEKADNWYADTVVYPFGYGLSYTNFKTEIDQVTTGNIDHAEGYKTLNIPGMDLTSVKGYPAKYKTVDVSVTVTNNGTKAGKQVVEIYSQAPYTVKGIEKSAVNLVGYAKTPVIAAGSSATVTVTVNFQDMASYDYADANKNGFKGYELEGGEYSLYATTTSHVTDQDKATINITGGAMLGLDDFSDNVIKNLFSAENGRYNSLRNNDSDWNGDGKVDDADKFYEHEQVLLSRGDFAGTMATIKAKTKNSLDITDLGWDLYNYYRGGNFKLSTYEYEYKIFNFAANYAVGDTFALDGKASVYKATKASPAKKTLTAGEAYAVDEYILSGNNLYKATKAIAAETIKVDANTTAGSASVAYAEGDIIQYNNSRGQSSTVVATKAIAAGEAFSTSGGTRNCSTYNTSVRLVTSGDDANVVSVSATDYVALFAEVDSTKEQSGWYRYSDKLYAGIAGLNGYDAYKAGEVLADNGLMDATAEMMEGWSQMADATAQLAAKEAAGEGWILFVDLAGIRYDDKSVIQSGKLAGMTGEQAWLKFMNQFTWKDFVTACFSGGANGSAVANLGIPSGGVADDPKDFQNGTYTWCCNDTIASTWNVELVYEEGKLVAQLGLLKNGDRMDGDTNNKEIWLNPAINFQRTPFSGRNNEYYGQDGYLAGHLAQAIVRGIQEMGVGSHLKHMLLNDQETNRNGNGTLDAFLSEQAFREIYAKPFQMAIQEGGAVGSMSAFAAIGFVPTPSNYNMCILLIEEEWGAEGFVLHPDMYNANMGTIDMALRAGHNHISNSTNLSGTWDADIYNELTGTKGGVIIGTDVKDGDKVVQESYLSNNQWYIVRLRAMQMMSEYAQTAHAKNGVDFSRWTSVAQTVYAGDSAVVDVSFKEGEATTSKYIYTIASGVLPEGLTLDESTGKIVGTVAADAEAKDYEITVKVKFDGWLTSTKKHTITVADFSAINSAIAEINEKISAIETDVAALKTAQSGTASDVTNLTADIAQLKTDLAALKTAEGADSTKIGALETKIADLETKVAALEAANEGGCNSSLGVVGLASIIGALTLVGAVVVVKSLRKKEND